MKKEKPFTDENVKPYFKKQGHEIDTGDTWTRCGKFTLQVDILSTKGGCTYVTEVKRDLGCHRLHTAIGQLLFHKFRRGETNKSGEKEVYQIVLHEECEGDRLFPEGFRKYIEENLGIRTIFVPSSE